MSGDLLVVIRGIAGLAADPATQLTSPPAGRAARAVYTLFGSKDALVGALGVRTMEYLGREVHASTASNVPVADVVAAGLVFRRFALEHPALCSVAFHRASAAVWPLFRDAAAEAFGALQLWFEPLAAQGLLGDRTAADAAIQFDALCEGIAWMELRGNPLRPDPERFWRSAVTALVTGLTSPPSHGPIRPHSAANASAAS